MSNPDNDTFQVAQDHIFTLMYHDCFPRFIKSKHYKQLLKRHWNSFQAQKKIYLKFLGYFHLRTYTYTYLLARPLGAFQSQMDKAQWIKTRPQRRELRALLFVIAKATYFPQLFFKRSWVLVRSGTRTRDLPHGSPTLCQLPVGWRRVTEDQIWVRLSGCSSLCQKNRSQTSGSD